jgi:putative salt-induced outer membrane protein YdiY
MTSPRYVLIAGVVLTLLATAARADEVRLKNGDRLTGKITSAEGGKLKLTTKAAGDLTIDLKDVETFSTDAPIAVHLKDRTVVSQRMDSAQPGTIQPAGEGAAGGTVSLSDVESINPNRDRWTGSVVIGGLIIRGNSDTTSLNVNAEVTRRTLDDRLSGSASYIFSRERDPDSGDDTTTADNWSAAGKYDYFFTKKFYGFASLRGEHDRIADLDLRLTPSVGVGYQWIESPDLNFNTEAGLAWVYEEYSNAGNDDHVAARLAYHVDKKFNERVALRHNLEYLPSLEDGGDFNVTADLGVRTTLTKNMFTELKVEWKYDATPAPGAAKNDQRFLLGVGWSF